MTRGRHQLAAIWLISRSSGVHAGEAPVPDSGTASVPPSLAAEVRATALAGPRSIAHTSPRSSNCIKMYQYRLEFTLSPIMTPSPNPIPKIPRMDGAGFSSCASMLARVLSLVSCGAAFSAMTLSLPRSGSAHQSDREVAAQGLHILFSIFDFGFLARSVFCDDTVIATIWFSSSVRPRSRRAGTSRSIFDFGFSILDSWLAAFSATTPSSPRSGSAHQSDREVAAQGLHDLFSILDFRFWIPGSQRFLRRHRHRHDLVQLIRQTEKSPRRDDSGFTQNLEPVNALVRFLLDDGQLGDHVGHRFASACRPVVCSYARTRAKKLFPNHVSNLRLWQCLDDLDHPQSHPFGPVFEFPLVDREVPPI